MYDVITVFMEEKKTIPNRSPLSHASSPPVDSKWDTTNYGYYINMVRQNGLQLERVPMAHRTPELCNIAAANHSDAFMFFPEDAKTREVCERIIGIDAQLYYYVPKKFRDDPDMSKIAVKRDGRLLGNIPEDHKDKATCMLAVNSIYAAMLYVPSRVVDQDICDAAVMHDGNAHQFVPRRFQTLALFKKMVDRYGEVALNYLYKGDQTYEKCAYSILRYPSSRRYILELGIFIRQHVEAGKSLF